MMRVSRFLLWITALGFVIVALAFADGAHAQFGSLKKKVEKKVEKKADEETDKAVDQAVDETYDAAVDAATGSGDSDDGDALSQPDSPDKPVPSSSSPAAKEAKTTTGGGGGATAMKPGEGAWANYDFVPGDRVMYTEDFAKTPVGDFPRRLEFIKGNMEVAEWNGRKYLRINGDGQFEVPLPEALPDEFTVEVEAFIPNSHALYIYQGSTAPKKPWGKMHHVRFNADGSGNVVGGLGTGWSTEISYDAVGKELGFFNIRIMMSGRYMKVYGNEKRLANVPNSEFDRSDRLAFQVARHGSKPEEGVLIASIRIAEGGKKYLYDELEANGRVATQGIYFDVDSDRLRPESTPTLKDMGGMLTEHADLRLMIEGHTDSQGDEAHNQTLSQQRAVSVKAHLVDNFGIDGSRLETKGFGESKPVDSNDTPEGRQNNRRVELVKLN